MTLFLEITRELLIKNLEIVKARIERDDASSLSMLRDRSLSEYKKRLASHLLEFVYQLKELDNDLSLKNSMIRKILDIQTQAQLEAAKHGYDTGKFGDEMLNLIRLIENIFQKFLEVKLLDLMKTPSPLSVFCYQAGSYLAYKAEQTLNQGYLGALSSHPKISSLWELALKKEKILADKIQECKEALEVFNPEHPRFHEHYRARVLDYVEEVIRENQRVCEEHGTRIPLPLVSIGFLSIFSASSSVQPKSGLLNFYMDKAKTEILKTEVEEHAVEEGGVLRK